MYLFNESFDDFVNNFDSLQTIYFQVFQSALAQKVG